MRPLSIALTLGALLAIPAALLVLPGSGSAASYVVSVSRLGPDAYQVSAGDLPSGTTISTPSCFGPDSATDAILFWFGPGSNLNEILFQGGSFCLVADIDPQPILLTPT